MNDTNECLKSMYASAYFPNEAVDQVRDVLLELRTKIQTQKPANNDALLTLTHEATNKINDLQQVFWDLGSEIETGARECIAAEFEKIVEDLGYTVDTEDVIATRDW